MPPPRHSYVPGFSARTITSNREWSWCDSFEHKSPQSHHTVMEMHTRIYRAAQIVITQVGDHHDFTRFDQNLWLLSLHRANTHAACGGRTYVYSKGFFMQSHADILRVFVVSTADNGSYLKRMYIHTPQHFPPNYALEWALIWWFDGTSANYFVHSVFKHMYL